MLIIYFERFIKSSKVTITIIEIIILFLAQYSKKFLANNRLYPKDFIILLTKSSIA